MSIQRKGQDLTVDVQYTASGAQKLGLTGTVNWYAPDGTKITGTGASGSAFAQIDGGVLYTHTLPGSYTAALSGNYRAVFHTADLTVDLQDIATSWYVGMSWTEQLDASISGIAASVWSYVAGAGRTFTSYGTLVADAAAAVWAAGTRLLTGNVSVGGYAAGQDPATLVLDTAASGHASAGTIGAAIQSASATVGVHSVALHFVDANGDPISGAVRFTIRSGSAVVGSGITEGTGVATIGLSSGSYTILGTPTAGVVFPATAATVSADATVTITGNAVTLPAPPEDGTCTVYLQAEEWTPSDRVFFTLQTPGYTPSGWLRKKTQAVGPDSIGRFIVTLPQGCSVAVTWDAGGLSGKVFEIPADATTLELTIS